MKNELSSLHRFIEDLDKENICPACPKVMVYNSFEYVTK